MPANRKDFDMGSLNKQISGQVIKGQSLDTERKTTFVGNGTTSTERTPPPHPDVQWQDPGIRRAWGGDYAKYRRYTG